MSLNKIVKTEHLSKNIHVDLDKNDKPVGVEILGMKNDISHGAVDRILDNSLNDLHFDGFKEFSIDEYIRIKE